VKKHEDEENVDGEAEEVNEALENTPHGKPPMITQNQERPWDLQEKNEGEEKESKKD
jgi:hypothetical protein